MKPVKGFRAILLEPTETRAPVDTSTRKPACRSTRRVPSAMKPKPQPRTVPQDLATPPKTLGRCIGKPMGETHSKLSTLNVCLKETQEALNCDSSAEC